jgi:NAD(P)-dependent dehydrogenase (short-subunit alcohol dehydrogenase family)
LATNHRGVTGMGRYDGRVAVITGSARGIGFAIATRLA